MDAEELEALEHTATQKPETPAAAMHLARALEGAGRTVDAYTWFLRAAALFGERREWARVVSTCNEALRLAVDPMEPRERLAEAHVALGAMPEARHQLETLLHHHQTSGNKNSAMRIQQRIDALFPPPLRAAGGPPGAPLSLEDLRCAFCRAHQSEVAKLIAGPSVFICDGCIELCWKIITNEARPEG